MREEKQVHFVSGVSKFTYWMATTIWDFAVNFYNFFSAPTFFLIEQIEFELLEITNSKIEEHIIVWTK